ncbi:methylmalonyl-CoA mutase subunit beta [Xanthovirga aplysinae]|uniref:methylmalonyl-CoA mutase subunit beta n=1 Tax=Xanthovirga aplysinae TaxID=2529853 RepID=UPI0012BBA6D2|nr:methylmalonyl-CoA mutase subunit beta [Xanthovirga aplysinae]MTI32109.1 hypothetical protein [Xanthovirga aplysinae]
MKQEKESKPLFSSFKPVNYQQWKDKVTLDLKGADFDKKLLWKTPEGFIQRPYYTQEDLQPLDYLEAFHAQWGREEIPGQGLRSWSNVQTITVEDEEKANKEAIDALMQGAEGICFQVNAPVSLQVLLQGIQLEYCQLSFHAQENGLQLLKSYFSYVHEQNVDFKSLKGFLNVDVLTQWITKGDLDENAWEHLKEAVVIGDQAPHFFPIMVNSHPFHDSGANVVQELAFTLGMAVAYLDHLTERGVKPEVVIRNMAFNMAVGNSYFMEIAKLKAFRLLFFQVAQAYGLKDYNLGDLFIHVVSGEWDQTLYDTQVNMLRNTTTAMAAIIGGCNSLSLSAHDAVFKNSTKRAKRIARNVSTILKEESYLDKVVDPAAGATYIERLSDSLVKHAWELFQKTEGEGGFIQSFKNGLVQQQIDNSKKEKLNRIAYGQEVKIGTNQFPDLKESIEPEEVRSIKKARGVEWPLLQPQRGTLSFEAIRLRTEQWIREGYSRPAAFLALTGNKMMRRARASFSTNFLGCAGFGVEEEKIYDDFDLMVEESSKSSSEIVVFCSSDENYLEMAALFARQFKAKGTKQLLILAGDPKENELAWKEAGFDCFIHKKVNAVNLLTALQEKLFKL